MRTVQLLAAFAAALVLVVPAATDAKRTKDITPYRTFHFTYTKKTPGVATGLRYRVALAEQGEKAPVVERLDLTFAKGTTITPDAVPTCTLTDEEISGGQACPAAGRIATGQATVYIGSPDNLVLDAAVFPSGPKSIVVTLSTNGAVIRILRGTLAGRTLTVLIPPLEANGHRVALVAFSLDIGGGSAKKPVFRTPKTCTKKGWDVVYAPTFDPIGKVSLTDTTACAKG